MRSTFQPYNFVFYFADSSPAETPYTGLVPIWPRIRPAKPNLDIRISVSCPKWTPCAAGCTNCVDFSGDGDYGIFGMDTSCRLELVLFPFL